ncbi:hypothetical protein J2741_001094 [Methanolinea mesophila]|uniref:carboxypeptidase-like regulatory domain-containing protein n=1 Tax=Methanolinea mesophila TaxID=547055 RepID=UPI001AE61B1C|nr:carboxypeptidase-like regulatory domain-containing protein [Methanolinea mesophila]MBP1928547.1 hypothetical protein [Methanolinea mesophila]
MQIRMQHTAMLAVLSLFLIVTVAGATTVAVSVYEKEGNITFIPQASVYADGAPVGKTDSEGMLQFSHPGISDLTVKVVKTGYDEWSGTLGANATNLLVELMRKNLTLSVQVYDADMLTPISGAEAYLTGPVLSQQEQTNEQGLAEFRVLAGDTYTINVRAPNYQARSADVEMALDSKSVQFLLYRDDRFALVIKDSADGSPVKDAEVFVDGVSKGITDSKGAITLDLPRGKIYNIRVTREGYEEYSDKEIIREEDALITIPIDKARYKTFVMVYDQENHPVAGVTIQVNGSGSAVTDTYGKVSVSDLLAGTYLISAAKEGYQPANTTVMLTSDGQDVILPIRFGQASVLLYVQEPDGKMVPGAQVLINGEEAGTTDAHGQFSTHITVNSPVVINTTKEGYQPGGLDLVVPSGSTSVSYTVNMQPDMDLGLLWIVAIVAVIAIAGVVLAIRLKNRRTYSRGRRRL